MNHHQHSSDHRSKTPLSHRRLRKPRSSVVLPIRKNTLWFFAVAVIVLSDSLFAQNPLRAQVPSGSSAVFKRATSDTQPQYEPHQPASHFQNQSQTQSPPVTPRTDPATQQQRNHSMVRALSQTNDPPKTGTSERFASQIMPAGYNVELDRQSVNSVPDVAARQRIGQQPVVNPRALEPTRDAGAGMNFIERESQSASDAKSTPPKKQNLGQLISKLGMNLAFVLALAIGGLLIAKQWVKPKSIRRSNSNADESNPLSMQIVETLRIDAKTMLHLVECGTSTVLVATDSVGIKSVNLLSPSFDETLLEQNESYAEASRTQSSKAPGTTSKLEAYRSKGGNLESTSATGQTADGMDEKLIRMLLENSKKRQFAR